MASHSSTLAWKIPWADGIYIYIYKSLSIAHGISRGSVALGLMFPCIEGSGQGKQWKNPVTLTEGSDGSLS